MPSTGLVPNVGEAKMVGLLVNQTSAENLRLRLYQNNLTPTSTMTLADYTEATFTGYAPITLSSSSWEVLGQDAYITRSSGSTFTCSATTSESIYGFYLTGVGSSTLFWSERFDEAPKVISFVGDALAPSPGIIVTRTSTALDVLTGLVSSWPFSESTGARRDLIGGNDFTPYYEEWATGTASTASHPNGTVTRFTQGHTVLTDLTFSGSSGLSAVIGSTSGGLPVFTAGQHFHVFEHSVVANNAMFVATGTPSSSSLPCTKQDWSGSVALTDAVAEAAKIRNVNWLFHGNRVPAIGTQFASPNSNALGSYGQINLDGALGISFTYWVRIRTGAIVGQVFFVTGAVFISQISLGDANSTVLTQSLSFVNDAGGSTTAPSLALPALDTWYFIACRYDPATGKAGISRDGGAFSEGSAIVGGHPVIGVGYDAGYAAAGGHPALPSYSNCDMAQLNLWNKVITQAEIDYLMTKRPL